MSEAKNAEEELAKVIANTSGMTDVPVLLTIHDEDSAIFAAKRIARALLAAGYAKRSDTIEEDVLAQIEVAAQAIKPNAFAALEEFRAFSGKGPYIDRQIMLLEEECQGARSSADAAIYALRNLKDKP